MARPLGSGAARASRRSSAGSSTSVDSAPHGPALAQVPDQPAGVEPFDPGHPGRLQLLGQAPLGPPARGPPGRLPDQERGHLHPVGLGVGRGGAVVADLGRGHADELAGVRRVGQDLLVAAHGGVEHHLPGNGGRRDGERLAPKAVPSSSTSSASCWPVTAAPAAGAAPPSRGGRLLEHEPGAEHGRAELPVDHQHLVGVDLLAGVVEVTSTPRRSAAGMHQGSPSRSTRSPPSSRARPTRRRPSRP